MTRRKALHWCWFWLAGTVGLSALCAVAAQGQTPPPVRHLTYSPEASRVLDSLAHDARTRRVENGACVTSYRVADSLLVIERLTKAVYDSADSISIRSTAPICPPGVPVIHTHVAFQGMPYPSDVDLATEQHRGIWNLLLSIRPDSGYFIVVY